MSKSPQIFNSAFSSESATTLLSRVYSSFSQIAEKTAQEADAKPVDYATDKIEWLKKCKIPHPVEGLVFFNPYEYQIELVLDGSRTRLILKSRQTGVSQTIALEALHDALYNAAYTVLIVSKDKESAQNVLQYVKLALEEGCPRPDGVRVVKDNESEIRFSNRSKIRCIAASKSAGRSVAASHVYMDEAAFPQWAAQIYRAIKPTISTGGRITILSTPDGRANLFYLLWNGEIGQGYSRHRIHWTSCRAYLKPEEKAAIEADIAAGVFSPADLREGKQYFKHCEWYRGLRPDFTAEDWASEFDCDFVQSGLACFKEEDVEAVFKPSLNFESYISGEEYISFWDIGRRRDATVGTTYRLVTDPITGQLKKRIVAWERFEGLPYPGIAGKIKERVTNYPGLHFIESNSIGDPVLEMVDAFVEGQNTGAKSKVDMITALIYDVESGLLEAPPIPQLRAELLMYQWDDKRLIQDCVMSAAGASLNAKQMLAKLSPLDGEVAEAFNDYFGYN